MGASWYDRLKGWLSLGPPVVEMGSEGEAVVNLQHLLGVQPADGSFGPITDAAVKAFQGAHGIEQDGVVGPITWGAFGARISVPNMPTSGSYSMAGAVMQPLPDGAKPLPQAVANNPAITAFAVELVHSPSVYAPGSVTIRQFGDKTVAGRIEAHTWTHRNGKLVTGLTPPIRGASLYLVPDGSMAGEFSGDFGRDFAAPGFGQDGRLPGFPGYTHSVSSVGHEYRVRQKKGLPHP